MKVKAAARKVLRRYGDDIVRLVGGDLNNVRFVRGDVGVANADAGAGVITVDPDWLKSTNRVDFRGAIIHELTHVARGPDRNYNTNKEWGDRKEEIVADAVRYSLLGEKGGWDVSGKSRRFAEEKGWTNMAGTQGGQTGPSLPGQGKFGGRMRNTMGNLLSHNQTNYKNPGGAAALPMLDPAATANYYNQLGGLYAEYQNQLQQLKLQRVGARAGFKSAIEQIKSDKVAGIAQAQGNAMERGVLGSSSDLSARAGVRGAAETARQQALMQRRLAVQGSYLQEQQAGISYYQNVQAMEADKLAQQQALLAAQLEANAIQSGAEYSADTLREIYEAWMRQYRSPGSGRDSTPQPGSWQGDYAYGVGGGDGRGGRGRV
jgi:general stress protein YciG